MQRELADGAVDATALPCPYAIDPVDGGTEDVLASLTEAVLGAGTAGTRAVDASWQKRAKTAMIGVKTAADHGLAVEELAEVMEPVLEQMENNVRNTWTYCAGTRTRLWRTLSVDASRCGVGG